MSSLAQQGEVHRQECTSTAEVSKIVDLRKSNTHHRTPVVAMGHDCRIAELLDQGFNALIRCVGQRN